MSTHSDFILTPIASIINDAAHSCSLLSNGMSSYPLGEYLLQSIFLKMTGAQEQKFKCVVWELATVDYTYRYNLLREGLRGGECSSYEDKNKIFVSLCNFINSKHDFTIKNYDALINTAKDSIEKFHTTFSHLLGQSLNTFHQFVNQLAKASKKEEQNKFIKNPKSLFDAGVQLSGNIGIVSDIYRMLWEHRNRCAHNLQSYQDNLPSFSELNKPKYQYYNYLVFMYVLILIDYKLIEYFKKFLEITEKVV